MRLIITLFLTGLLSTASAEQLQPPGLQPLPPPPPLNTNVQDANLLPLPLQLPKLLVDDDTQDAALGQEITPTKPAEQTVEEFRMGGKLYMIKITPKIGPPYYLVDDLGDGKFSHHQNLDSGFRAPRWIIHRF